MRFKFDSQDFPYDVLPYGKNIFRVRDSKGAEMDFSFLSQDFLDSFDSILPGPVWKGLDSEGREFHFFAKGKKFYLHYRGKTYVVLLDEREFEESGNLSREIRSPMPGKILKIFKKEGDFFEKGEVLGILEAMKMENQLKAGSSGSVSKIFKKEGDVVDQDEILMDLDYEA